MTESEFKSNVVYAKCMDQIVDRVGLLIEILDNGKTTGNESFDYEIAALNFRKILELIAYASLAGHHEAYLDEHKNASQHYRAKAILDTIEKINPAFYPVPVTLNQGKGTKEKPHHMEHIKEGFLTREEFIQLYDKCSEIVHVKNILLDDPSVDFLHPPKTWLKKITNLLDRHTVQLVDSNESWFVTMKGPNQKAHVYSLGRVQLSED